jgi:hypothetical protein
VVVGGGLQALKHCRSKMPLTNLQSRAYIASNMREMHGIPLGIKPHPDPEERSIKKKEDWWLKP